MPKLSAGCIWWLWRVWRSAAQAQAQAQSSPLVVGAAGRSQSQAQVSCHKAFEHYITYVHEASISTGLCSLATDMFGLLVRKTTNMTASFW